MRPKVTYLEVRYALRQIEAIAKAGKDVQPYIYLYYNGDAPTRDGNDEPFTPGKTPWWSWASGYEPPSRLASKCRGIWNRESETWTTWRPS